MWWLTNVRTLLLILWNERTTSKSEDTTQASGRTQRRTKLSAPCRSVRVVGDRSSLEIFLNDGAAVFSTRYYPAAGDVAVKISGTDALVYSL